MGSEQEFDGTPVLLGFVKGRLPVSLTAVSGPIARGQCQQGFQGHSGLPGGAEPQNANSLIIASSQPLGNRRTPVVAVESCGGLRIRMARNGKGGPEGGKLLPS